MRTDLLARLSSEFLELVRMRSLCPGRGSVQLRLLSVHVGFPHVLKHGV